MDVNPFSLVTKYARAALTPIMRGGKESRATDIAGWKGNFRAVRVDTITIALRLTSVHKADRIVVMNKGRIVAAASHLESLFRHNPLYARLAELQFGKA